MRGLSCVEWKVGKLLLQVAYLDEFGHIGPYISRTDARHKTSPIFGLGGLVLPSTKVRQFATFFFQLKCNLLKFEIDQSGQHPAKWEKKGASLYTTQNVQKYRQLRVATNRLLNQIEKCGGYVFYVGLEKAPPHGGHRSDDLYRAVLREAIKRLDESCEGRHDHFMVVLDEQKDDSGNKFRHKIVEASAQSMFGQAGRKNLIEPPFQAESHLYQTLQCADWICGLVGRLGCYQIAPTEYIDFDWAELYFGNRLRKISARSGIRKESESAVIETTTTTPV